MQLRRYRKNWLRRPEKIDSSVFVAFWGDEKFVSALDVNGVEWMLVGKQTLKMIQAGDAGLVRIHRGSLVRLEAVEAMTTRNERSSASGFVTRDHCCVVGGREFKVSRKCKPAVCALYDSHVAQQGEAPAVAA